MTTPVLDYQKPSSASSAHGWVVVLSALAINLILGVLYAWSVMGKALSSKWGWDRADAALPFTVSTGAFAITMIFAGRVQDKIGPRMVATVGGALLGLGMIASSFAHTPTMMLITFGIIGGIGIGLGYSATTPPAIKWFPPKRKGLITGIVVAGVGLAAVYMAPLTNWLLGEKGDQISQTFLILGIGTIVVTAILAQMLRNPPAGYSPAPAQAPGAAKAPSLRNLDWHEMLATRQFFQLWIMFSLAASAGLMIIAHVKTIADKQAKWDSTLPIVIVAIFNTLGRLLAGAISDRIGRTNTMVLAFVLQAVNMCFFVRYNTEGLIIFGAAFTGLCYGTIFTLFPATTADFYGIKNLGVNYGIIFTGFGLAGIIGPYVGGIISDHSGKSVISNTIESVIGPLAQKLNGTYTSVYANSYIISAILLILAAILALTTRAPKVAAVENQPQKAEAEKVGVR